MAKHLKKIDAKGRVFIPAKLRDGLGGNVVVAPSIDANFLTVYTPKRFYHVRDQFSQMNSMDVNLRRLYRRLIGESLPCELDSQGRIAVSAELWDRIEALPGDELCILDYGDKLDICKNSYYTAEDSFDMTSVDWSQYSVTGL